MSGSWEFIIASVCSQLRFLKSPGPGELSDTKLYASINALGSFLLLKKMEKDNVRESGLATIRAELTSLHPFCLEKEGAESPWRPRWEETQQLQ